ncbi:MAG TPA: hypothetical protein VNY05_38585 [Candidatus Acidoferrales bacterium]|nr:hypothetical protein [Candidatus Acidoferrales bacterium]
MIFTNPSHGRGSHNQIPRGGENLRSAERLPEFDIEIAPGILAANQTSHHETISHPHHYHLPRPRFRVRYDH